MNKTDPSYHCRGQFLGLISLGILVLFTWLPNSYYLMVSWPWIALWPLAFFLLGIWAIWLLRQGEFPFRRLGYGFDWVVGLTVFTLTVSALSSQFKSLAIWQVTIVLGYCGFLYVLRNWLGTGLLTIPVFWLGLAANGLVACILGLGVWWQKYTIDDPRNAWPLGQPNFLAGYILLVFPLCLFWGISQQGWRRIVALGGSGVLLLVLYTTSSRGGFLGLLVLVLAIAFMIFGQSKGKHRTRLLWVLGVVIVLILGMLLTNSRVQQLISPGNLSLRLDGESQGRLLLWQTALIMLKNHPLWGIGPGNMARLFDLYTPIEVGATFAHVQQLHSTPMQIIGELGLFGLTTYILFLGCYLRLWLRLRLAITDTQDRYLLYGLGGGVIAYTFSSLTDYQLDNIAISVTLVGNLALLIRLGDNCQLATVPPLNALTRRWLSLGGIVLLIYILVIWLPIPSAMRLSAAATVNFREGNVEKSYEQASLAASLVPWDPIYPLQAAYDVLKVRDSVPDRQLYQALTEQAIAQFQDLIDDAAPNDATFNQVLGMLYGEAQKTDQALVYLGRAVQLFPRSPFYTYFLLGQEYLKQGNSERAIAAFVLQGLVSPSFLTSPLWQNPPLSDLRMPVVAKTIELLAKIETQNPLIQETLVLLRWWFDYPLGDLSLDKFNPLTQALILIDSNPEEALRILENQNSRSAALLKAWLAPEKYLTGYLETIANEAQKKALEESILQERQIRNWLSSFISSPRFAPKIALTLTYRNYQGRELAYIPLPSALKLNTLVNQLGLFPEYPLAFLPLDELVNQFRTEQLGLPHPSTQEFRLSRTGLESQFSA